MADGDNNVSQQPNKQQDTGERPLDPSRSAEDLIGDTTGLAGITTGSAEQTSSEPSDKIKNENKTHLPGGLQEDPTHVNTDGIPITSSSPIKTMSNAAAQNAEDIAQEADISSQVTQQSDAQEAPSISSDMTANVDTQTPPHGQSNQTGSGDDWQDENNFSPQNTSGDDSLGSGAVNTGSAPYQQSENLGEQSVSGTTPAPSSDDDTLANAHSVGTQLADTDNGEGQREELDIARDVDEAEQQLKDS